MWTDLKVDEHYEILVDEPYTIRKKENNKPVSLYKENSGYMRLNIGRRKYLFHVLLAKQFINNPNPSIYKYVDHINRNKLDNSLSNLRWTTSRGNSLNKSSVKNREYEFVDELPANYIEVRRYGNHNFENLYYCDDTFYFYNDVYYRKLYVNRVKNKLFVNAFDTNGNHVQIYIKKFRRLHNFDIS